MDSSYAKELSLCLGAVRVAARISQSLISSPRQDKDAVEKDDLSPVTVADFAVQALLVATVRAAFPGDTVVGEEDASALREKPVLLARVWQLLQQQQATGHDDEGVALPSSAAHMCELLDQAGRSSPVGEGRTWIFDPIDGTRMYLAGGLYAVNMALLVDGAQTVGCVACPNMAIDAAAPLVNTDVDAADGGGCVVYAVRGHGAYAGPLSAPDTRDHRRLPPHASSDDEVRFVTSVSMADSALENVHPVIASRLGAAFPGCDLLAWVLRWTALALGLGNTTVWVYKRRDRRAKVWDHAGAMLLFEETGGRITDLMGKDLDLTAGRTATANFGFIAAPRHLHSRVLQVARDVLREHGHDEMLL